MRYPGRCDLRVCTSHEFVLITNDLDFPLILAHTRVAKPSVILLREEPLTPELRGPSLVNAIAECEAELESGAVLTVDWWDRVRARVLPLKIAVSQPERFG